MFERKPFKFDFKSLEPFIDSETMQIHSEKHHQAYTDNLNAALEELKISITDISSILTQLKNIQENLRNKVKNNGGGFVNHNLFFDILSPIGSGIHENDTKFVELEIIKNIIERFGTFEIFKDKMINAGLNQFGSGWVFLFLNAENKLELKSYPNQDTPLMEGFKPILGIDVWEHAYYLKYQNRRGDYLKQIWNVIDWQRVNEIFLQK